MITRRDFLHAWLGLAATGSGLGAGFLGNQSWARATSKLSYEHLLSFDAVGQVSLLHYTDTHAQIEPIYFREPNINLGVGEFNNLPPHLSGDAFLQKFGLERHSAEAYALTYLDFVELAKDYGKLGGFSRLASMVNAIRAERPDQCLLLDCGDSWQGSYTSLVNAGGDMVQLMNALGTDAMTGHWEFTYGTERVNELIDQLEFAFLAGNVRDTEWEEPVFDNIKYFERGGVKVAVIGQAFPFTPVANPRYMIPDYSFGIREAAIQASIDQARQAGARLVVLLSHNGFDVDRKLASRVTGVDVILTGHTHDALPDVVQVGKCLLVASGSHGKFLSRLDVEVGQDGISDYRYKLMPIFSDIVPQDQDMQRLVDEIRAPHKQILEEELAVTETTLYRRGNLNGSFDDLICMAMLEERDAEIALSPGFRWGTSLLPGQVITGEDVFNVTSITYPACYRLEMTGEMLHAILEDVGDNLFNPDPYYQQGGDMVRVGGMGYRLNPFETMGNRISDMTFLKTGEPIDPNRTYIVTGWASVNESTQGPPIYNIVTDYLRKKKTVNVPANDTVKLVGV